jgi:hypothetical protein
MNAQNLKYCDTHRLRHFCALILVALVPSLAYCSQSPAENIDSERAELSRFFDQLAKEPGNPKRTPSQLQPEISSSDMHVFENVNLNGSKFDAFQVNSTLEGISVLAALAAQSIGSPSQTYMASQLQATGSKLETSGNPGLQQEGQYLTQESMAVTMGDQSTAESLASTVGSQPKMDTTGLTPNASDTAYAQSVQQFGLQLAKVALATFSQSAVQAAGGLLKDFLSLGSFAETGTAGILTAVLSQMLQSAAAHQASTRNGFQTAVGVQSSGQSGQIGNPSPATPSNGTVGANGQTVAPGNGNASGSALPGTGI